MSNTIEIQLEAIADSLEKLEKQLKGKKEPKDHSADLETISRQIKALERLSIENANNAPEIDLSSLESKFEALNDKMDKLERSARHMQWLFPDLKATFWKFGVAVKLFLWIAVIGLGIGFYSYYQKADRYEESATKYYFYKYSAYTMSEIDSLYKTHADRINFIVDSTQEARAKRSEIEARKKQLEEEEKSLNQKQSN
ncbi:hypothetical protein MATR_38000 (plasmid) [Marivirga tractuosa]|uniref:Uncharacterized protein n=1 Tax=Marivirga tractuosa (strain ATCC 23168 / DSM 4126 / NBRC 15989 / NCIMB 1408 / VKM B-1430 / H-43) TaxID=643867 RepID=E4TW46_MARTH|nr:hypothetical protein [Marivirga tractuosa]ADR23768.1 hypothetical protein Ftrac_3802 [Marivirga tractuosa DSM 4126]BDD16975.1 hypothetical protein MATR_38000 [Marivirga tractuosa]